MSKDMLGVEALPPGTQAALLVTVVLVEAIVLYVGYGYLEEAVGPKVLSTLKSV